MSIYIAFNYVTMNLLWRFKYSGILRLVDWQIFTDVSAEHIALSSGSSSARRVRLADMSRCLTRVLAGQFIHKSQHSSMDSEHKLCVK
jgi:hypothetical protein